MFDIPLPAGLARFGASVRASLCGPADAPLVVLLGGISADHCPALRPDGSPGWWSGLAGAGAPVDLARYRLLGLDFASDPAGREAPGTDDQARILLAAIDRLGVERAHALVGASYGGMIALAFAQAFPDRVERLVVVSADARAHPASTAMRELQRRVVALGLRTGEAAEALSIARGIAMLSYRTPAEFAQRFQGGIEGEGTLCPSEPGAYLKARGEAFVTAMSPQRFLSLSASIDRHRVDPARIAIPTLLLAADSDQLVPLGQMERLAARLAGPVELHVLSSLYGHDMFLKEAARIAPLVRAWLETRA